MNKQSFVEELRRLLSDVPWEDAKRSLEFYSEMIDDLVEEGKTEEEAVASIGTPEQVAASVRIECFADVPPSAEEVSKEKKKTASWVWVLLILGSPIWGSLGAAVLAVSVSLFAAAVAVFVSLFAVVVALGGAAVWSLVLTVLALIQGNLPAAGMLFGMGLFAMGLTVLSLFPCILLTKKIICWIKSGWKKGISYFKERRKNV